MRKKTEPTRRNPPATAPTTPRQGRAGGEATPAPSAAVLRRREALVVLLLALLVGVSYVPALSGGFVWDDMILTDEPVLHRASGLWSIWLSPGDIKKEGHYWPLVYTTFWLEHKLWGLAPAGYHAVNVLLHLFNCLLVWRLLARLAVPGAVVTAAVFAVHPLHVESVAWIIERKDVLSGLFYLCAVLAWIRFTEAPRVARYALALVLFTAGLLSKSVVVTLPAALLIWHWWQYGRVTRPDLLRLAPFFAVGLAVTIADVSFYASREVLDLGYTLPQRALIAARALWFYAGKLLWPADLAVIYPLWEIDVGDVLAWGYVIGAAALAALLWLGRRRLGRGPLAGASFFAVTLAPTLGFVDYGYMQFSFVADRFQYLAGIGVMAVLIGAAAHGVGRLPRALGYGGGVLAVLVVALLGALTWRQAGIYRDQITLFSHVVSLNPEARDAHLNLASALIDAGRPQEGLAAARLAVEKRPDFAAAHSNLGLALVSLDRFDEAEEHLHRALELDPRHRNARLNLAELLRRQGRHEDAVAIFREVIEAHPDAVLAHAGMGESLFRLGRFEQAATALQRSLALRPDADTVAALHGLLGQALHKLDRLEAAAQQYERALMMQPQDAHVLTQMANLRAAQGRSEEADDYLRRARALKSQDAATLQNVAESLRKQGRYEESLAAYRAVLDVDASYALAHAGMGDALFRLQRYDEALAAMSRAVTLQPGLLTPGSSLPRFMGRAAQELGRPEAAAHFERALELDPRDTEALERLAMLRFGEQRYDAALGLYRRVAAINPDSAQTHANLGATLYHLGRFDEALEHFERALVLDPDLEAARVGLDAARGALPQRGP